MAEISQYTGSKAQEGLNIIEQSKILQIDNINTIYNNNEQRLNNLLQQINNKTNELHNIVYPVGSIIETTPGQNPNNFTSFTWEKINLNQNNINADDFFNAWFKTKGLTLETDSDGKKWFLIYNVNSNSGATLFNIHNALCWDNYIYLWMLMDNTKIFLNGNKYEFKLNWPDYSSTGYNHWTQTSNPLYTVDYVNNYSAISCTWTYNFGGLSLQSGLLDECSGSGCLLAGCQNHSDWFYAISPFEKWSSGTPGPLNNSGDGIAITGRTQLRIRVPGCENINISSLTNNIYWKRIS